MIQLENFKYIFHSLRISKDLNQEQLASALGVSKSTIAMWETGKRLPSPDLFEQIADFFNIDIDYLYGRTDIKRKILFDEFGEKFINSEHSIIMSYYDRLNSLGKQEAEKRVEELTFIARYTEDEEDPALLLNAAHRRTDIDIPSDIDTSEDEIMNDKKF